MKEHSFDNTPELTGPPRFLRWLFHHLIPYDTHRLTLEEIDDVYLDISEESGRIRALAWYCGEIIRSVPASTLNTLYWSTHMFKHYSVAAFRNFKRNGLTTTLNLVGLSVAVGATIVMFLFIDLQLNMDEFHEHLDQIYLVEYEARVGDDLQEWGNSPLPLGPAIAEADPDVLQSVRMGRGNAAVRYEDIIHDERLRFVDKSFFDVFSFPVINGDLTAFNAGSGVVLSDVAATRFFGHEDPVGAEIFLTLSSGDVVGVTVSGVAEKAPMESSFRFNILVPIELMPSMKANFDDWGTYANATFLHLRPDANVASVEERMQAFLPLAKAANAERDLSRLMLESLKSVPTRSGRLRQSPLATVFPFAYLMFGSISLMILLVSCFNYVNIAIATAMRRSKEIGIRKVVGSYRVQLIIQFLGENLLLSLGALVTGIFMAEFLFIPWINTTQDGLAFRLNYLENKLLWVFLLSVLGITGLGAGLYPAIFVSRFQPSQVLRGTLAVVGKRRLTRALLSTQLVFSFLLLAFGASMLENAKHQRRIDWGYDQTQRIVVPFADAADLRAFEHEIVSLPDVIQVAGTADHIGNGSQPAVYGFNGHESEANQLAVGFDYLTTMGVRLNEGRFFDSNRGTDGATSVVINRTLKIGLGLDDGESVLGRTIRMDGNDLEIVGVTEDFYESHFLRGFEPLIMRITEENNYRFLIAQVTAGTTEKTDAAFSAIWKGLTPDLPYNGFYQDTILDGYFEGLDGSAQIFLFISFIALLISVMGLFGLVLITVTRRGREIGIRKTLGASVFSIIRVMQLETIKVVGVALVIGVPLSYFAIKALFDALSSDAINAGSPFFVSPSFLVVPVLIVVAATFATSFMGAFQGASANPVEILRQNAD